MANKMTVEERIAHFLRMAQDSGATQHERDVAAEQAERLMIKHGIDKLHLPSGEQPKEKIVTKKLFFGGTYATERKDAAGQVAWALKLKWYQMTDVYDRDPATGKFGNGHMMTLVGFESDVADALRLIASLDVQAAVAVKQWARGKRADWNYWDTPQPERTRARKSFLMAFGQGAGKRIKETRRQVVQEEMTSSSGTALVLASREAQVNEFYDGLNLRTARRRSRMIDSSAYGAGHAAGYSANTGANALGGGQRSLNR